MPPGGPASLPDGVLDWVRRSVGSHTRLSGVRLLGVSSTVLHCVDVTCGEGSVRRLLVRRFHDSGRLASDRWYLPANEARVLGLLERSGVPAPRLLAADTEGTVCDVPTLLITRLPGSPPCPGPGDLEVFLHELAGALVAIHAVDPGPDSDLPAYAPYYAPGAEGERRPPAWSERPRLWERIFELLADAPPSAPIGFIHRDYHHHQTLWSEGRLTGVVDWTTGCVGPRGIDLSRMQLNLVQDYGVGAARRFLAVHERLSGESVRHPYWDLLDAADALPDMAPPDREAARRYRRFEDWAALALGDLA